MPLWLDDVIKMRPASALASLRPELGGRRGARNSLANSYLNRGSAAEVLLAELRIGERSIAAAPSIASRAAPSSTASAQDIRPCSPSRRSPSSSIVVIAGAGRVVRPAT